jgi:hypothetical protein
MEPELSASYVWKQHVSRCRAAFALESDFRCFMCRPPDVVADAVADACGEAGATAGEGCG